MFVNAVGRHIPEVIGEYKARPFLGLSKMDCSTGKPVVSGRYLTNVLPGDKKLKSSLTEAITEAGLKNGMTISFHHCFRAGDQVIGQVLTAIREMGIRDLNFAPSGVVNVKPSIVDFIKDGTIKKLSASGIRGELGNYVLDGKMEEAAVLRSHGSRPRAIESGELVIDVAFIGASAADEYGNCTGQVGPNACGAMGYSFIDATTARKVIVITDNLVAFPCVPITISQEYVDYVVKVDSIGDPSKIGTGSARITKNPRDLAIAKKTAKVIAASRRFKSGFVFQAGAGAISIACMHYLAQAMRENGIVAGMALGGIPSSIVNMHKEGLIRAVACSQSFDGDAARAIIENPGIMEIDNSLYANPSRKGCMLNQEDFGILGALEVDTDFNVNIVTGCNGEMMGGLGGGPDVAAGAQVSLIVLPIVRGRIPSVVKRVYTCCTPGETVAVVVTEAGIALNPSHKNYLELKEDLEKANIKTTTIEKLQELAESLTGKPEPIKCKDKVTCIIEYRDGTVIDVIREMETEH